MRKVHANIEHIFGENFSKIFVNFGDILFEKIKF
jgi:hypothetical protein